jgi:hypothetical protein
MENGIKKPEDYFETLVQNIQKGEMYSIKFKNDPVNYTGIPFIRLAADMGNETVFIFKVLSPDDNIGILEKTLSEIEILQRKAY